MIGGIEGDITNFCRGHYSSGVIISNLANEEIRHLAEVRNLIELQVKK